MSSNALYGAIRFRDLNSACVVPPLSGGRFPRNNAGHRDLLESVPRERLLPDLPDDEDPELGYLPGDFIRSLYTYFSLPVGT